MDEVVSLVFRGIRKKYPVATDLALSDT